eukprot:6200315-Pleurochrysis_carterae.AAC.1
MRCNSRQMYKDARRPRRFAKANHHAYSSMTNRCLAAAATADILKLLATHPSDPVQVKPGWTKPSFQALNRTTTGVSTNGGGAVARVGMIRGAASGRSNARVTASTGDRLRCRRWHSADGTVGNL